MSERREMPEQRAFSPDEVATMLGVSRTTILSLLSDETLGSTTIGDARRVFLSDLEEYLGEKRAHSLVREINRGDQGGPPERSAPDDDATGSSESGMDVDFEVDVPDREEAERELGSGGGPGRTSQYEPIAQKWAELADDESIVLSGLEKNDVQNLRNLLYRRFGKESVIVRKAKQEDGTFKAVVRAREGNEYLRDE
jgi:excisionase family DNA binding protein